MDCMLHELDCIWYWKPVFSQVENLMNSAFQDKHIKEIKEISAEHRQLGAAMENLRQIFTVPESIDEIRECLKSRDLLKAHKILRELEISRDELLYEQHKLENHSQADIQVILSYFRSNKTHFRFRLWTYTRFSATYTILCRSKYRKLRNISNNFWYRLWFAIECPGTTICSGQCASSNRTWDTYRSRNGKTKNIFGLYSTRTSKRLERFNFRIIKGE